MTNTSKIAGAGSKSKARTELDIEGERVEALDLDWKARLHSWRMQEDEDYHIHWRYMQEQYEDHVPYEKWK